MGPTKRRSQLAITKFRGRRIESSLRIQSM